MAGYLFFWQRTGLYSAAASDWLRISTGGVADVIANSVWTDDYLWGDCKKAGEDAECVPYVRAGGAVGHNEVSIIIPCHRVVGTNGSLTGYAGGIDKKVELLTLEHTDMSRFFAPKKGTAL